MSKKIIAVALAALLSAGAANAELKTFTVNGEKVTAAEQKVVYDRAVKQGQPAGPELEHQVKQALIQQKVLLQAAKASKVGDQADVKKAMQQAQDQVLVQAFRNDYVKKNPVKDADVKKVYDEQKRRYGDTEYQVRHILVKTEDQAKNLIKRLNTSKGKTSFEDLAKEFSEDVASKEQGGLLGWVVPRSYPAAFGAAFSALKTGEVAQSPIRTQYGYHIIKLEAKRKAELFPNFESQKAMIANRLAGAQFNKHVVELIKNAKIGE